MLKFPISSFVIGAALQISLLSGEEAVKKQQSQIKGLLVIQLAEGEMAGSVTQMNATITAKKSNQPGFEIGFNQQVGKMMKGSSDEVGKFIRVRRSKNLPKDIRIELAFADKFTSKDGPSAAVACALMSDALFSGREIDSKFAVTGDMTATGEVRPVGGVQAKISGATKKNLELIAIPESNKKTLSDNYLIEGLSSLYSIQVFSISTFAEAAKIAHTDRDEELQKALDEFAMVQRALKRNEQFIFNTKVREKLKYVVESCPNHLSARLLLLHSLKRGPKTLSLSGSISGINKRGSKLSGMLESGSWTEGGGNEDVLFKFQSDLIRLRPKLDKRTVPYADAYDELTKFFKENRDRKILTNTLRRQLTTAIRTLTNERKKLYNNPEVREELMLDE